MKTLDCTAARIPGFWCIPNQKKLEPSFTQLEATGTLDDVVESTETLERKKNQLENKKIKITIEVDYNPNSVPEDLNYLCLDLTNSIHRAVDDGLLSPSGHESVCNWVETVVFVEDGDPPDGTT